MLSGNVHKYVAGNVCTTKNSILVCDGQSVHDNRSYTQTGRVPVSSHFSILAWLQNSFEHFTCTLWMQCRDIALPLQCMCVSDPLIQSLKFHELSIVSLMLLVCIIAVQFHDNWMDDVVICDTLPAFGQLCKILQSR